MTPTPKLRFVERKLPYPEVKIVRILQQWWQTHATGRTSTNGEDWITTYAGEWRDVPIEKEQT
jgi:hypothetical protein